MRATKNEIKRQARYIVRMPYCNAAHRLIYWGNECGAAVKLGSGSGMRGWNWDAYRLTNSNGGAVIVVVGRRDLFGDECRDIVYKYEKKARAVEGLGLSWKKAAAKYAKLCRDFADAVIFAEEFGRLYTNKKNGLITNWAGGFMTFEPLQKVATKAAQAVRGLVEFVHGENAGSVSDVFGLPYTSSGDDFAAIWNTNATARLKRTGKSAGDGLFFRGVAIEKADGKPQAVTVWKRLRDGEEVGTEFYTVKELKEEAKRW
nr:MAG TPA: hypothetical protein [Caudoviricetes sp.]